MIVHKSKRSFAPLSLLFAAIVGFAVFPGCEQKEKVIDVETPAGEVEVERNKETGEVDVEVNDHETEK